MGKRVKISDSSINCYGTRVLTTGLDIDQYLRNSILLYMHWRGEVIGYIKDVKKEGDDVTGEPVFDECTERSRTLLKQWEFGSIKMVSANVEILTTSDDPADIVAGQTRGTVTKSKLIEVSIVDIGGNDNALILSNGGEKLELAAGQDNPALPLLKLANDDLSDDGSHINNKQKLTNMDKDLKAIALKLGLPESATESEILSRIELLKGMETANLELKKEIDVQKAEKATLQLSGITAQVDAAITAGKLTADKKDQFITLGKQVGVDTLKLTLDAMVPAVKPMGVIGAGAAGGAGGSGMQLSADWKKLSDVPADKLLELRSEDKPTYMKLYKAEYGIECKI